MSSPPFIRIYCLALKCKAEFGTVLEVLLDRKCRSQPVGPRPRRRPAPFTAEAILSLERERERPPRLLSSGKDRKIPMHGGGGDRFNHTGNYVWI